MRERMRRTLLTLLVAVALMGVTFVLTASIGAQSGSPTAGEESAASDAPAPTAPGEREVRAMAASYPEQIDRAEVRDGEWALLMNGRWYYWADGRLLPEEQRAEAELYVGIRFYRYTLGPLPEREIDADLERVLEDRTDRTGSGSTDTRERFNGFLDELYGISSEADAERIMRRIAFLGSSTRVHPVLVEPLARVERTILAIAPHEPDVRRFLDELAAVHGYNWRTIANTVRRSYHSYGVAVDLVPRSYGGRWPYWLWAAEGGLDRWWELPSASRWTIPQPIIDAFEANGFIWGGKWLFFDNLHFEYRPESIHLARQRVD